MTLPKGSGPARPPLVMMYSHDGFGLGHLRRNSLIARGLVARYPEVRVVLLTGHAEIPFPLPNGVDSIKLPSIVKVGTGVWRARTLSIDPVRFRDLRARLIELSARSLQPDVLLVDYMPTGVWEELTPTLEFLRARENPTTLIFGFRDILDDPGVVRARWESEKIPEALRNFYDKVLIYGDPEVFDTAARYGIDEIVDGKVSYCGYLCTDFSAESPAKRRRELRVRSEKLLVLAAGGGYDAHPMMSLTLEAVRLLQGRESFETMAIPGPLMPPHLVEALEIQSEDLPVRFLHGHRDPLRALVAADASVTMGGYNTLVEILSLGTPVVVIPRVGPSREQTLRAALLAGRGLVTATLPPGRLHPAELAELIREHLHEPRRKRNGIDLNGLGRVVEVIAQALRERNALPPLADPPHDESLPLGGAVGSSLARRRTSGL